MIIQADSRYIPLEDKSVNCIITSPPYWSLRKYDIPDLVWDEGKRCKHQWGHKIKFCGSVPHHGESSNVMKIMAVTKDARTKEWESGSFCSKCRAWKGQLGLEPTIDLYLEHLLQIMDECWRVLRDDGTMWVNIGDSYGYSGRGGSKSQCQHFKPFKANIKMEKSLCAIPERFVIAMMERGWIRRNTIIWHKPNCMPSSANDRFTVDFEPVFFFTKSNKTQYWTNEKTGQLVNKQPLGTRGIEGEDWEWREVGNYEGTDGFNVRVRDSGKPKFLQKATEKEKQNYKMGGWKKVSLWTGHDYWFEQQQEPVTQSTIERFKTPNDGGGGKLSYGDPKIARINPLIELPGRKERIIERGANKRCVWTIPTQPYPESHFATFPETLIEPMIRAGCPKEICKKCNKPRERIEERESYITRPTTGRETQKQKRNPEYSCGLAATGGHVAVKVKTLGYTNCDCNVGFTEGIVLDPFCGTGTVGKVANRLFRKFIGIDLGYKNLSSKRTRKLGLLY